MFCLSAHAELPQPKYWAEKLSKSDPEDLWDLLDFAKIKIILEQRFWGILIKHVRPTTRDRVEKPRLGRVRYSFM